MKHNKIIDFLSITHFLFFYVLGIYVKNNYKFAFILGILWEFLEFFLTSNKFTKNLLINYWIVPQRIWDEDAFNINRISDICFNILGYHFGNKSKKKSLFK